MVLVVNKEPTPLRKEEQSAVLHRHLDHQFLPVERAAGNYIFTEDGRKIYDGSGGPSVACIGWGNERVIEAITRQLISAPYCATIFYTSRVAEELGRFLVDSTKGHMARAYIVNSGMSRFCLQRHSADMLAGSEAMEAAVKLARQYFLEKSSPEPQRTRFIARQQSYHGTTLGALVIGGHAYRREHFEPLLPNNVSHVSPCYAYRQKQAAETDEAYVARLAKELEDEFQRVGPDTVCAFVAEPVVGAVRTRMAESL
jgi:adenosylmethionine-8-amino-7-oxononanoate aminotransferase